MPNGLTFNLYGRDVSVGSTLRNAQGQADQAGEHMSGSFKKIGAAIAGAFAVDKVKDFLGDSMDEAREAQKVGAQTGAVLKSTGEAANISAQQVGDLAGAISAKAGIDDEAIQSGENLLLTFTGIRNEAGKGNDIFNQTTQIMTDMSVATGQDMTSSAMALGKALNDPIAGVSKLTKVGVTFTDQQKEQIKTLAQSGDAVGAQKIILAELTKEFGGSAAAQATSADKMGVAFGNIKEQVGTALLPMMDTFASVMTDDVVPALSALVGWLTQNWSWLKYVAGAAVLLWAAMKAHTVFNAARDAVGLFSQRLVVARGALLATGDAMVAGKAKAAGFLATYGAGIGIIGGITAAAGLAGHALGDMLDADTKWTMDGGPATAVNNLSTALVNSKGDTTDAARSWAQAQIQASGLADKAAASGITIDQLTTAILGGGKGAAALAQRWRELGDPSEATTMKLGILGLSFDKVSAAQQKNSGSTASVAGAQQKAKGALDQTTTALGDQKKAGDALLTTLAALSGDKIGAAQAELRFKDGLAQATEQVKQNGASLADNTSKGRANREWLLDQLSSLQNIAGAQLKAGESTDTVTNKLHSNEAALRQAAVAAGMNAGQVDALVAQYGKLPPKKVVKVYTNADQIRGEAASMQAYINGLHGKTIEIVTRHRDAGGVVDSISVGGKLRANAQGTGWFPGGATSINEQGNEIITLPSGTKIDTASTSDSIRRMSGGGGGPMIGSVQVVVPPGTTDPQAFGRMVGAGLETFLNSGGTVNVPRRSLAMH